MGTMPIEKCGCAAAAQPGQRCLLRHANTVIENAPSRAGNPRRIPGADRRSLNGIATVRGKEKGGPKIAIAVPPFFVQAWLPSQWGAEQCHPLWSS